MFLLNYKVGSMMFRNFKINKSECCIYEIRIIKNVDYPTRLKNVTL